jgi:hypothetical protein
MGRGIRERMHRKPTVLLRIPRNTENVTIIDPDALPRGATDSSSK